jgi:Protein of unknown function (DUF4011)/REase_MTES_1575/AAA domain/Protein of unknown function (DUF3320)
MTEKAKLIFQAVYSPIVNYAMQQNHVPVIRELIVTNQTEHDLSDKTFRFSATPEFALPCEKTIAFLPKNQPVNLGLIDLQLSPAFLAALTERLSGMLTISAVSNDEIIQSENVAINVLAFDEWSGYSIMPEMISAFVTPNHPEISKIMVDASQILEKWSGDPSLDAYQSRDPNRVKLQVAAVYAALQAANIVYCVPPASFEELGQRVRLCDIVLTQKLGTCLDLSLLYASCLEAIGLNPLIIIIKGHAFFGVWLVDDCFSECVQDDVSLLTKRLADGINQICVVEATAFTAGKNVSFTEAETKAKAHLATEDNFICLVDVKRTRASSIRPLPMRVLTPTGWEVKEEQPKRTGSADAPESLSLSETVVDVSSIPLTRQQQWERKLLDLSLRNTLLNFRTTSSTVPLLAENLGDLEDSIATGNDFQVLEKPSDWENTIRDVRLFENRNNLDPIKELLNFEFQQNRVRTPLTGVELNYSMTNLFRSARTALEENGANTLYLALGFLKWYESGVSQKARYAPIVLIPIEIIRKSAKRGFVIRSRDEEVQMNITLLEMLRQDFGLNIGGLDPLPRYNKGVDLKLIFNVIRQVIMNMPRWDVVEEAFLGIFSFSQFIMWNDLKHRSEDLAKNKIVTSLMSGKLQWVPEELVPAQANLDELYLPESVFLPVSADSSQLGAIAAASEDKSFVLHGPPGTGKSQTITNIIANALAKGKTVLFVAEKMAALSVVQRRLEGIGLGPFCLELHSNKVRKKYVLDQLKATTELVRTHSQEDYEVQAKRLSALRSELNGYVQALYKKYPFDVSLYDAITRLVEISDARGEVEIDPAVFENKSRQQLNAWMDLANELAVAGAETGHPYYNPLGEINLIEYSQSIKASANTLLQNFTRALKECAGLVAEVSQALTFSNLISTPQQVKAFAKVCQLVLKLPGTPSSMLKMDDVETNAAQIKDLLSHGERMADLHRQLLSVFQESVLNVDALGVLSEWQRTELQWFLPKLLSQNRITKMLRQMAVHKKSIVKTDIPNKLNQIIEFNKEKNYIEARLPQLLPLMGHLWQDLETDWKNVHSMVETVLEIDRNLILCGTRTQAKVLRSQLALDLVEERINQNSFERYNAAYGALCSVQAEISRLLKIDMDAIQAENTAWFSFAAQRTAAWTENIEGLREWCAWLSTRKKALEAGLTPLVTAYESGYLENVEVVAAFEKGLNKACAEYIIANEPALNLFSGKLFEEKIRQFRQTNDYFEELTCQEMYTRLAAKIPNFVQEASQSSELGILQRAIKSNGRGLSIRKLFEQIPNLLPRLSPCMLMSPISVAQYLDPKYPQFDLVVFDEASQMPTSEAVGAMARGKNAIVVGDPKQLPPTSFFAANRVDEDNFETEDLESILDDCLALSMPETHLLWHYRSKHESLIAFSNMQYYENKLLTFPSPNDLVSNVKLCLIDGFYDRGKTKHNKAEARAVVDEIVRRLKDPVLSKRSIGVVTFSSIQQNLIDDLLVEVFKENPELEERAMAFEEAIFIKNLENVQGDERDVILFSVGYGPDQNGKLTLNFGPLNRDGGWRRLNVAVSRARYEMLVYSTIRPEELDITRTSSQGVAGLKAFLEFAQKGKQAIAVKAGEATKAEAGIGKRIVSLLEQHGYAANTDIGCSGYRVDVGIVHPHKPDEYILGIMCDGAAYKNAGTARDREILQFNVLRQLGWNLHKVWALDWWENPEKELRKIISTIEELLQNIEASNNSLEQIPFGNTAKFIAATAETTAPIEKLAAKVIVSLANPYQKEYVMTQLQFETMSSDEFFLSGNTTKIKEKILQVINCEAPISKNLLCKRVLQSFGIGRMGSRIERRFGELFHQLTLSTTTGGNAFFWKQGISAESIRAYRVSSNEADRRNAEDLPPEETAYAVKEVLSNQIGLPREDLIRETARILGYQRIGKAVEPAMNLGIEIAIKRGWAAIDASGNVILV